MRSKILLTLFVLIITTNIFAQTKFSDLPVSEWNAQRTIIKRVLDSPGGQWFWESFGGEFDQAFRSEVVRIMK